MLAAIRRGNPNASVTILIATGCHRGTTREELIEKFGREIVDRETIVIHDCAREADMVTIGTLPSGGESFLKTMTQDLPPAEILHRIQATEKKNTLPDQWESQILARILSKHRVVLVS